MDKQYVLERLANIVGPEYVTDERFILLAYTRDFGTQPARWPAFVVRPGTVDEAPAAADRPRKGDASPRAASSWKPCGSTRSSNSTRTPAQSPSRRG